MDGVSFIGRTAGDSLLFYFSDSLAHKSSSTVKRLASTIRAISKSSTKSQNSVSSLLICASNCFEFYEQKLSFSESLKHKMKIRFCIIDFKLRQTLNQKCYIAAHFISTKVYVSDFESKTMQRVRF